MYHPARDHVLHLGRIRRHVRGRRVRLERLRIAPLFDEDEQVAAEFRLDQLAWNFLAPRIDRTEVNGLP